MAKADIADIADIALILEGTYPYVLGGVSAWVDQIIRGLPEFQFALFFIGSQKSERDKKLYELPANVVSLTEVYLHDRLTPADLVPAKTAPEIRAGIYQALKEFYACSLMVERVHCFWNLVEQLDRAQDQFTFANLCYDVEAWELLQDVYRRFSPDESFIDFFWTARFLHLPLWTLWRARQQLPRARVFHTISAGYAGLIASVGARLQNAPLILTEHGIYTKERIAEISQADWIYEGQTNFIDYTSGLGKLKQMWVNLFLFLGQVAYETSDDIITLYEGNALTQVEFGAEARKIQVIPNGIEPAKFDAIRDQIAARWQAPLAVKSVGFIGRVVPIKDVKTLMRAARLVCERCPEVQFLIAGPYAEDFNYFDECQKIAKLLRIDDKVHFMGMQKLMEVLPKMDILVLTSISEGLPLVVLEAMAAGLPVVTTDVGACRELIFGRAPEDRALGAAGRLTKIISPHETANGLVQILQDPELHHALGIAGRKRAEQFYSNQRMLGSYRDLYRRSIDRNSAAGAAAAQTAAAGRGGLGTPVAGVAPAGRAQATV